MKKVVVGIAWVVLLISLAGLVIVASLYLSDRFISSDENKAAQSKVVKCEQKGVNHTVLIQNDSANPVHTEAKLCDTLTIINSDSRTRLMSFGIHSKHVAYDGVTEQNVANGKSLTVTLNQTGSFLFHDHIGDVAQGNFTVSD